MTYKDDQYSYHVFLSYNSHDRVMVEHIAVHLTDKAQLKPWFDQWRLVPGDSWVRNLERGLAASSSCAVFVGRDGEGAWQTPEVEAALRQQVMNRHFRVIPVLLPGAGPKPELPPFLDGNHWVDFRQGLDDDNALWKLECGILGKEPGRGRPPAASPPQTLPASEPLDIDVDGLSIAKSSQPAFIFICCHQQEPSPSLAHAFAEALKIAGHDVFIDTKQSLGTGWAEEVKDALNKSDYFLLLLSKDSGASETVVEELAVAKQLSDWRGGRPIILPVRLIIPFAEPLPYQVAIRLHGIPQEHWVGAKDTPRLISRLLERIEGGGGWDVEGSHLDAEGSLRQPYPQPQIDPRSIIIPGGSVDVDSRFYIIRAVDEEVYSEIQKTRALITVRGPRQAGKTSLMLCVLTAVRRVDKPMRTAFIDFQGLETKDLQSLESIWFAIATRIARQLRVPGWSMKDWEWGAGYDHNISSFLENFVFGDEDSPLVLCLDEVDNLFGSPINSKFFSTLRVFYNRGAIDRSWKNIRWLLGSSSEPSFFLKDVRESPFNIGLTVELNSFTRDEVRTFAGRHGLTPGEALLNEIMDYVGGRPYLVHLMLYHLTRRPQIREQIFNTEIASKSIFRDHLSRYLIGFQQQPSLAAEMKRIIEGRGSENDTLSERLEAAGLVHRDMSLRLISCCRLYSEFFSRALM
jgi:hypothetical protein